MGHRSYLTLNKSDQALVAFEANNSLPFFWLTLIDKATLQSKVKDWKALENDMDTHPEEDFTEYSKLIIQVNFENFQRNSSIGLNFLTNYFPKAAALYRDFIEALKSNFEKTDQLAIDIYQLSAFYEDTDTYISALTQQLEAIEQGNPELIQYLDSNDLISTGIGFTCLPDFSELSSYRTAMKKRRLVPPKSKYNYSKKNLMINIVILLICPFFTFLVLKGFRKEGISGTVILLGLSNLGFYLYSIWEIKAQLKAYKMLKTT